MCRDDAYVTGRDDVSTSADHVDFDVVSPPVAAGADLMANYRKKCLLEFGGQGTAGCRARKNKTEQMRCILAQKTNAPHISAQ